MIFSVDSNCSVEIYTISSIAQTHLFEEWIFAKCKCFSLLLCRLYPRIHIKRKAGKERCNVENICIVGVQKYYFKKRLVWMCHAIS